MALVEGKYSVASIHAAAKETVEKRTRGSQLLDVEAERRLPKFDRNELEVGRVLGRGYFGVVSEVTRIKLLRGKQQPANDTERLDDEHEIHNVVQDRTFMSLHYLRGKKNEPRYAIKILQDKTKQTAADYIMGITDMAVEARFLAVIRHSNIIKMRAMAATDPFDPQRPFFLVLDRLYDVLGKRIATWKKQVPTGMAKVLDRKGKKQNALWTDRCGVCYDLANALHYLHQNHVMYRDLKPENIGFDVRGDVKIFDFGLAREFDLAQADSQGFYAYTGDTGSPRYMAPEVALGQRYNEGADVYSFSILVWQVLALSTPYEGFNASMLTRNVVKGGSRPRIDPKWSKYIADMLRSGWGDKKKRLSMKAMSTALREEMNRFLDDLNEDGSGMLDASRKSEASIRGMRMEA